MHWAWRITGDRVGKDGAVRMWHSSGPVDHHCLATRAPLPHVLQKAAAASPPGLTLVPHSPGTHEGSVTLWGGRPPCPLGTRQPGALLVPTLLCISPLCPPSRTPHPSQSVPKYPDTQPMEVLSAAPGELPAGLGHFVRCWAVGALDEGQKGEETQQVYGQRDPWSCSTQGPGGCSGRLAAAGGDSAAFPLLE